MITLEYIWNQARRRAVSCDVATARGGFFQSAAAGRER